MIGRRRKSLSAAEEGKIDRSVIEELYERHGDELRRLLRGVLRDEALANDAFQATFVKALEHGHTANAESRKSWLFRVAYNEAMLIRRRAAVGNRVLEQAAWIREEPDAAAETPLMYDETVSQVREAIDKLTPEQRQIVRMRIYEEKKFAAIAAELHIPLGTALGRMRTALLKLRQLLTDE